MLGVLCSSQGEWSNRCRRRWRCLTRESHAMQAVRKLQCRSPKDCAILVVERNASLLQNGTPEEGSNFSEVPGAHLGSRKRRYM
jgi:hypothetical protein